MPRVVLTQQVAQKNMLLGSQIGVENVTAHRSHLLLR